MTRRRCATLVVTALIAAAALPGAAAAQSFVAQPQQYLLTTMVYDGRALWVQPAGLARRLEASIAGMATADRDSGVTRLGQYGLTVASGGLGLGWQHDRFPGGAHTDAFAIGYAAGGPGLSVGFDHRWHRGTGTKDAAWDVGLRYRPTPVVELSAVWRDISSPVVLGDTLRTTVVPGAAIAFFGGHFEIGADWEIFTSDWGTSAIRTGVAVVLPAGVLVTVRSEMDRRFSGRSLAFGVTWSGPRHRVTGLVAVPRGTGTERYGAWGSMVAEPRRSRRFGR